MTRAWLAFFLRYVAATSLGTAAIWFGSSAIKPELARDIVAKADAVRFSRYGRPVNNALTALVTRFGRAPELPSVPANLPSSAFDPASEVPIEIQPTPGNASPTEQQWGIVNVPSARCYNRQGKYLRRLEPGTIIDVESIQDTKQGTFAVCTAEYHGARVPGVVIRTSDIRVFAGSRTHIAPNTMTLLVREATIEAQLEALQRQMQTALRPDNPFADAYDKARTAYTAYANKVNDLRKRYDSSEGNTRETIGDQLRELRTPGFTLKRDYDRTREDYSRWNDAHPREPGSSPEVARLTDELASLRRELERTSPKR